MLSVFFSIKFASAQQQLQTVELKWWHTEPEHGALIPFMSELSTKNTLKPKNSAGVLEMMRWNESFRSCYCVGWVWTRLDQKYPVHSGQDQDKTKLKKKKTPQRPLKKSWGSSGGQDQSVALHHYNDCHVFSLLSGPLLMSPLPWPGRLFDTSKGLFLTSCHAADLPHPTGLTPRGKEKKKQKKTKLVTWPSAPCPRPQPPCWQQKVCWSQANARNCTRHRSSSSSLGWHGTTRHAQARVGWGSGGGGDGDGGGGVGGSDWLCGFIEEKGENEIYQFSWCQLPAPGRFSRWCREPQLPLPPSRPPTHPRSAAHVISTFAIKILTTHLLLDFVNEFPVHKEPLSRPLLPSEGSGTAPFWDKLNRPLLMNLQGEFWPGVG